MIRLRILGSAFFNGHSWHSASLIIRLMSGFHKLLCHVEFSSVARLKYDGTSDMLHLVRYSRSASATTRWTAPRNFESLCPEFTVASLRVGVSWEPLKG